MIVEAMISMGIDVNKSNFEAEVLGSSTPVLVDFWAEWCGPCRMVSPILDEIANEYGERIKICKVNVDDERELAEQHQVVSIPTLVVYRNGQPVRRQAGASPKYHIESLFKDFIQ